MRVAVPPEVRAMSPTTGHGRVWSQVLVGLASRVELVAPEGAGGLLRRRRAAAQVWLCDGHRPLPERIDAPLVVQVHEASWHLPEVARLLDPAFVDVLEAAVSASVARADVVITGAATAARELVRFYDLDPARIVVAHHGVDVDRFSPAAASTGAGEGSRTDPYVLFVGALHPRKNVGALRGAMVRLADAGLPHRLVLVGAGAADRADPAATAAPLLAELPGHPGRIDHHTASTDAEIAALMAGASALCLPSFHEGFGLPALEAMACGTPVVVSDRGSLPEVVGDAGVVVAPTSEAIADGLRDVLADPARAADLGARGRARALTMTWTHTADAWLVALQRAADRS